MLPEKVNRMKADTVDSSRVNGVMTVDYIISGDRYGGMGRGTWKGKTPW